MVQPPTHCGGINICRSLRHHQPPQTNNTDGPSRARKPVRNGSVHHRRWGWQGAAAVLHAAAPGMSHWTMALLAQGERAGGKAYAQGARRHGARCARTPRRNQPVSSAGVTLSSGKVFSQLRKPIGDKMQIFRLVLLRAPPDQDEAAAIGNDVDPSAPTGGGA